MKLSINNYQTAANSRVLTATIVALYPGTNTADIEYENSTVLAVPIHYFCHHGVDDHAASRVFNVGDQVLVLYTGNLAVPDAETLTILGLKDEIRRCRELWDFVADISVSNGTLAGNALGKWGFLPGQAGLETLSTVGGTNWWTDGVRTLTWEMGGISRYSEGSNYGGRDLFVAGVLVATAPVAIAGAAMRGNEIIVIGESGDTYKFCDREWTKIGVFPVGYELNCAVSFNIDCSLAVSVIIQTHINPDNTYLVTFSVLNDIVSVDIEDLFVKNGSNWSKPIAADFNGLELVTAVLEYTRTDTGGEIVNPDELVWKSAYDPEGHYIVSYSGSIFSNQLERLTLTIGGHTTLLAVYEASRTRESAGWRGPWLDTTPNLSSDTTYCHHNYYSYISGLDLRVGLLAVYKRDFGAGLISSNHQYRQLTHDNDGNVTIGEWVYTRQGPYQIVHTRTKSITLLAPPENIVIEDRSDHLTGSNFTYPPESGFDLDIWSGPTELNPDGDPFVFGLPGYDYNYLPFENIDNKFISRQKNTSFFVSWRTSYFNSYINYSGGDLATLTGQAGHLYATSVKVI